MNIATEVQRLIDLAKHHDTSPVLDEAARPLLQHLKDTGKITEFACVEWQGAWEHNVIAISHSADLSAETPIEWFQIHPTGESYAV